MTLIDEINKRSNIITPLLGILGVILASILGYATYVTPDYIIFLESLSDTRPSNCEVYNLIHVDNLHYLKPYDFPIVLDATITNENNTMPEMNVEFNPLGSNDGANFDSQMTIKVGPSTKDKRYKIRVMAIGGDGKERGCTYFLNIKNAKPISGDDKR